MFTAKETESILSSLTAMYPEAGTQLDFGSPFELLVAVILSAQCTDKRVNQVTDKLFTLYHTAEQFAALDPAELEPHIFSCGFYRDKARHIVGAARTIVSEFGGKVPDNLEDLQKLDGVGRKTANVVYAVAFGGDAIAVDTHVFRVSNRIGLADAKNVLDTEKQLMAAIPQKEWSRAHHLLIWHGRYCCKSQKPQCEKCEVRAWCGYYKKMTAIP